MNPCTLGWYLPLLVKDVPGALQPSEPGHRVRSSSNSAQTARPQNHQDALEQQQQQPPAVDAALNGRGRGALSEALPKSGNPTGRGRALRTSSASSWHELDAKFRRDLPNDAYVQRLAYRGLVMKACANIKMLDGVIVSRKEKEKAERFLEGMAKAKPQRSS